MSRFLSRALLGAAALCVALAAVACDAETPATGDAAVIGAVAFLDAAGFHAIDEGINTDKTVPATAQAVAQKAATVVELTAWPTKELRASAVVLKTTLVELAGLLDETTPDLAKAGAAAARAHDQHHDFSHDVWAYLNGKSGVLTGHAEAGHE